MSNPEPMENHVITLALALDESPKTSLLEMGRIDGIAYNETIWSARFVGEGRISLPSKISTHFGR